MMTTDNNLIQKKQMMQEQSLKIIDIAGNEANSSLKCIHMLNVAGGATQATYRAIEERVLTDQDTYGAYHLALVAQSTPDLPIDARQLIELVVSKGDNAQLLSLLKNLPVPPLEAIHQRIMASNDKEAIAQMKEYLNDNPEALGSQVMLGSGQKDHIVPLSEGN